MFKRSAFYSVISAIFFALPVQTLHAQESTELTEEIVVTGLRASLEQSLDIKRDNIQVVDAVVAEDIGKFPDNNVVEALQRVTGVQVTDRGGGEVSVVTIRGLNDVTTTINGRNIFTSVGRFVQLQDIPASLLNRVDVYKTRSADLIESGIAGVIDIKTHRPFNFDGSKVSIATRFTEQEQRGELDPNISLLLSNRWETGLGELGALINISYAETNFRDQGFTSGAQVPFVTLTPNATGPYGPLERVFLDHPAVTENPIWTPGLELGLPTAPGSTFPVNGDPQEYYLARDAVFQNNLTGERERPAYNISLQLAPNDTSEYLFEAFYNGYRQETFNSLFFTFVDWWGSVDLNDPIVLYPGTNVLKERFVNFAFGFNSGDYTKGKTDSYLYAFGGKWEIGDNLHLESEIVTQDSTYEEEFFALQINRGAFPFGTVPSARRLHVDFNNGGGIPSLEFFDDPATAGVDESDLTNPDLWDMGPLFDNGLKDEGDALTFTVDGDLDVDWGAINMLHFGFRLDDRSAATSTRGASNGPPITPVVPGGPQPNDPAATDVLAVFPGDFPGLLTTTTDFFDGRAVTPTAWTVPDGDGGLVANRNALRTAYLLNPGLLQLRKDFDIDETTTTAYIVADFETDFGGGVLDGQFGVRYVSVDTDMNFISYPDGKAVPETALSSPDSAGTSKVLSSFMIRYAPTEDVMFRLAYGQTLRPPGFADLNSTINYVPDVTDIGYGQANGGNADLEPTESTNMDLTFEWYFAESSALYATYFNREIEGFVVPFRNRVFYDDPSDTPDRGLYPYILSQPDNASNGELDGFELGTVWFPENLPGFLQGFGIQASYTTLDSSQDVPVTNDAGAVTQVLTLPLFGVSDSSYSIVFAYDRENFDARLSYVWREGFVARNEQPLFANPLRISRHDEESLNFQLSYNVTDELVLTFDAVNLTDDLQQEFYGNNPTIHNFGNVIISKTYAIGARYSF